MRSDSPFNSIRCAWCIIRSRIASATATGGQFHRFLHKTATLIYYNFDNYINSEIQ